MTLQWNDSKTVESIKEAKAVCAHSIQEAKTSCSTAIREAEAWGASQAGSIQQSHAEAIQHLEEEAIEEESKGQVNILSSCQAALQTGPSKFCSMLVAFYHILLAHAPMSHPFSIPLGTSPSQQGSAPRISSPLVPGCSPRPKCWHHSPDLKYVLHLGEATSKATPERSPSWPTLPFDEDIVGGIL